jgi:hypothetical protein
MLSRSESARHSSWSDNFVVSQLKAAKDEDLSASSWETGYSILLFFGLRKRG